MRKTPIITIPNPILRQRAQKVSKFDEALRLLAANMVEMMRKYDGVGLAAPQIGVSKRMIVLEFNPTEEESEKPFPLTILVNPSITKYSKEKVVMLEGCLSLPDIEVEVERPKEVNVAGQDLEGKTVKIRAKGILARVLQHEIDHLNGVLFTDHIKDYKNIKHYRDLRTVLLGTPDLAVPVLEAMIVNGLNIVGVICETDKPVGRKQELEKPPVKVLAEEYGIPIYQPDNKEDLEKIVEDLQVHYGVVAAYGKILTKKVLEEPPFGFLNIHPSMLPKYRGATPVQNVILNGDEKTGVTIMKVTEEMDAGDILTQKECEIELNDTEGSLDMRLFIEGANLLMATLPLYLSGQIEPRVQDEKKATYTKRLKKEDGLIDWSQSAEEIERMVRAYFPWPKAYTMITSNGQEEGDIGQLAVGDKRLIFHKVRVENGKLMPEVVQLEGSKPTNWEDFKRGFRGKLPETLK